EDGIAKIGDFGLAVALDRSRLTTEGMMVGTVAYMPPEQAMGGDVTPRSDLYSLGAMLYEMVTGRPPFLGDDSVAIIGQHINTPPVAPTWHKSECPRALDALILRLLAKDPSERPESATDVLSALDAIDLTTDMEQPAAATDEANALDSLAGGVFVGRQREMGELKACLEDALSGRGRLVMLVGEPGIGKSRTAQELATYAGLRQAQVLWGRCYEGEGAPSYWPWVQAIRSYVMARDVEELRSEMGAGASAIAGIVSDVSEKLPGLAAPLELEPEQARFRLFDAITAFLKNASRRQPLVLVLDDLHWADHPSLLLLEFMARELAGHRILVIGTYRDMELSRRHPLSLTLGELNRDRLFQRVLLRGLAREDVGRFIELVSGIAPPSGMVEAVHRQTEGNPLFVTEVVRLLVQEGELTHEKIGQRDSWSVRIPEGVREVIGRRLDRLSERCNETLTIASVIGREFTLSHILPLTDDLTEDRLLEVLEEALAARVIEELPSSVGRYQFTHAMIQETLSEELSTTRKVRLHARIAEALEEFYGDGVEAHAAELANHFNEAQTVLGTDRLVRYSLLAGDRALANYANEDALAQFERGLNSLGVSLGDTEPAADEQSAELLFGLGRAQATTLQQHEFGKAVVSLTRAFKYYSEVGNLERALAVAEYPIYSSGGQRNGVSVLVSDALRLVPSDSVEAARLLIRYAVAINQEESNLGAAGDALRRALAIAQREGDISLEMQAVTSTSLVEIMHFTGMEGRGNVLRAIELAQAVDNPVVECMAHFAAGWIFANIGDLEATGAHFASALGLAEEHRVRNWLSYNLWANGLTAQFSGDWDTARDYFERCLTIAPLDPRTLSSLVILDSQVGDPILAEAHLEQVEEMMRLAVPGPNDEISHPASAVAIAARAMGWEDRAGMIEDAARTVLTSPFATPILANLARVGLGMLSVQKGDWDMANEQYEAIESRKGTLLLIPSIVADRLLGLLAHTGGNLDKASEHFEESLAFCRTGGYRPELAWTCCDYADTLLERNNEGDRAKAMSLLEESLAISSELGMRPLMERVLSRREILGA
ncbi:MAG: AAA family ATPase, partial [Chloroflexi bacterium]|nr:AAA family ATPase [Chloroflexota bacterium]